MKCFEDEVCIFRYIPKVLQRERIFLHIENAPGKKIEIIHPRRTGSLENITPY